MSDKPLQLTTEQIGRIRAVCKTHDRFETESWKILALLDALEKISDIRDSIVAKQGFHFSNHAYPLVAALDAVGFPGAGYEIASKNFGTLIEVAEFYADPRHWNGREFGRTDDFDDERDATLAPVPGAKARKLLGSPWR